MAHDMNLHKGKGGQISIYVIIGIVIAAVIVLVFLVSRGSIYVGRDNFNPASFIDSCVRNSFRDAITAMLPQGGFVNPKDYIIYQDTKVPYVCKNINYYQPCITQYPRYITHIEQEIEVHTRKEIESCFATLEKELGKRQYEITAAPLSEMIIDARLKPRRVELKVDRDFVFSKNEIRRSFTAFSTELSTPLYDLASVASAITADEAKFCYFEYVGYNLLYPAYDISKFTFSDSTKVYSIKDKKSGDIMRIAVRGCAIPPGF